MIPQLATVSLLVLLVQWVERLPAPPSPAHQGRGRPTFYRDRLFLKALVIMLVKHLYTPYELLTILEQDTPEMAALRPLLTQDGHYPTRRTWERRLAALPDQLPAQIRALGTYLVAVIQPWADYGRAVAADSTVLRATGGVGTRSTATPGKCRIPPSTPRPIGPNRAGMAGATAGNCTGLPVGGGGLDPPGGRTDARQGR